MAHHQLCVITWVRWFPDNLSSVEMYLLLCPYCVISKYCVFWDLWNSCSLAPQPAVSALFGTLPLNDGLHKSLQNCLFLTLALLLVRLFLFVLFCFSIIIWDYEPFYSTHFFEYCKYPKFGHERSFKEAQVFLAQLIPFLERSLFLE